MCGNTYSLWFAKAKLNFGSSLASFSKFFSPAVPCQLKFIQALLFFVHHFSFQAILKKIHGCHRGDVSLNIPINPIAISLKTGTHSACRSTVELSLRDYVLIVNPKSASVWCLCFSKNRNRLNWDIKRDISFVTCIYFFQDCLKTWALRPLYRRYSQRWW